jgi:hypothetical protein
MQPLTFLLLGGLGYYGYKKYQNPLWSPLTSLCASPHDKVLALEKVKVTSVPTPALSVALDPNMTTNQVHEVNTTLVSEIDPHKIAAHADVLHDLGHTQSANALTAKANAVGEAMALGASDADIHKKQLEAVAGPSIVGWGPYATGYRPGFSPGEVSAAEREAARHHQQGRGHQMTSQERFAHGRGRETFGRGREAFGRRGHAEFRRGRGYEHYRHPHEYVYEQQYQQPDQGEQYQEPEVEYVPEAEEVSLEEHGRGHRRAHMTREEWLEQQLAEERARHRRGRGHRRHHEEVVQPEVQPQPLAIEPDHAADTATTTTATTDTAAATADTAAKGWWYEVQPGYEPSNSGFGGYGQLGYGGLGGLGGYGSWGSFGGWGHGL